MNKSYYSLGLMSGTSGDGIDASIAISDGQKKLDIFDNIYEGYSNDIYGEFHELKGKIHKLEDIEKFSKELKDLERKLTLNNSNTVEVMKDRLFKKTHKKIDLVGFHGQTILHLPEKKFSLQLGDAKLLSQITNTKVVYKFRENDLKNGGQGAPLAPIFHQLLINNKNLKLPTAILNLGGIANITSVDKNNKISSLDIGPGNCLIDNWVRLNSKNLFFDEGGKIARAGKINKIILNQTLENFYDNQISKKKSFDTKDFDLSFVRGLSLEDGAATLTEFTADICSKKIFNSKLYVCGGGRKNNYLIERIEKKINNKIYAIDTLGINGDFVESQAFAYLAIRSYLNLPISFPETTGCDKPCTGGELVEKN
tara:strand:- start:728 stop:1831 length:1104 start_codon:yes stop_codon:yes gene_type:complete